MFINKGVFKKLIKKAFKTTGLHIEHTTEGIIAIRGDVSGIEIAKDDMTKEAKAAVIELIGELPEKGESILYRDGQSPQMELGGNTYQNLMQIWEDAVREYITTRLLFRPALESVIVLQSVNNGGIRNHITTFAEIASMIDPAKIDTDNGEDIPGPVRLDRSGKLIIWANNIMAMYAVNRKYCCGEEERLMDALGQIDLCWD